MTNRITNAGFSYDANGNLTAMPGLSLSYDYDNRLTWATWSSGTYVYDPDNRRVAKTAGPLEVYFYGVDGRKLGTYQVSSGFTSIQPLSENLYFAGRLVKSNGKWVVTDRLGSVVKSGTETLRYFPWGEEPTTTTQRREKFATYHRGQNGLDYALNRYYSPSHGRFLTPDPYVASASLTNPQSWNRYPYVENDPVNYHDPRGLLRRDPVFGVTVTAFYDPRDWDVWSGWSGYSGTGDGGPRGGPGPAAAVAEDPRSGGGVEYHRSDITGLPDAARLALRALETPECQGLFGGEAGSLEPAELLTALIGGNTGIGSVQWQDLGGPQAGSVVAATTTGILGRNAQNQSVFTGVTITINNNLSAPWFGGYPDTFGIGNPGSSATQSIYRSITVLHELGHAFGIITGAGGSRILDDQGSPEQSQANSRLIFDNCFR